MHTRPFLLVPALALALAACGGSSDEGGDSGGTTPDTDAPATTASPATTAPPETTAVGITSFDAVQPAVVQIIAQGTIRDPEVGYLSGAGSGSGFVISPDGLVVTNNHVVTGAATLEVYIGGELDDSYNATVVGVSECNDLALIQIDTDQELPHLEWYDGAPTTGLEIYAAGYPLGDPEFTLTRGIVAKAEAGGETPWASIDSTIEHDANIQPGNSGGPLVSADGRVVAVNYAGGSPTNTEQFFAISNELAVDVVDELRNGDFESLGINGQAIVDEESGIAGVWVSGVAPGSPASDAELLPGDIVTSLNGLPIGTDGTMRDYCDVIRTSGDRPIDVEVLRFDTQEILRGEINGDKILEQAFSFAEELEEEAPEEEATPTPENPEITGYTSVVDDTGQLSVDVPNEWTDVQTSVFTFEDGSTAPQILASPDLQSFFETWDTPGLLFTATGQVPNLDEELALWAPGEGQCTDGGIQDYSDALYTGRFQIWEECGGTGALYVTVAAVPADNAFTAILVMQVISESDLDALDQAFATFTVTPA
jgi:serine protease Do